MAESPSQAPEPTPTPPITSDTDTTQYWCYQCEKLVSIETLTNLPDVICHECKNGFVESIPATFPPPSLTSDQHEDTSYPQFLQVMRLISQAARDEDAPQRRTRDPQSEDDFLGIEIDGWENEEDEEEEDANENEENRNDDEEEDENENENEDDEENEGEEDLSDNENEDIIENDDGEDLRRRARSVLRRRLRDFASRASTGRNRTLDWAEILMRLEDSIEFRLESPESDRYMGNPQDYMDASGYEALLQNLAESDGGRKGAPPAAKSAVLNLPTVEILSGQETIVCAICKDMVNVGETATKLPCGHGYHGDCIVPWLGSRNSCPVCRFELPTDDPEYEEERKKRVPASVGGASGSVG